MPLNYYTNLDSNTLSKIASEQQLQALNTRNLSLEKAKKYYEDKEESIKKLKLSVRELNEEFKQLDREFSRQEKEIESTYSRELKHNSDLLKNLTEKLELQKKNLDFARMSIEDQMKSSKSELESIENNITIRNLLIEQNEEKLKNHNLTEENRKSLNEEIELLKKSFTTDISRKTEIEDYLKKLKDAKKEIDDFGSPLEKLGKRTGNFFRDVPSELKKYSSEQNTLLVKRDKGIISNDEFKRQSEILRESLSPLVQSIIDKMDSGSSGGSAGGVQQLSKLNTVISVLEKVGNILGEGFKALNKSVDDAVNIYTQYNAQVSSRLYGDSKSLTFTDLLDDIRTSLKSSTYVNQRDLIGNISKLVSEGIDYNLEQRALLMTLNDRLVPTFNVLDNTLTRMIKLQQSDLTISQMGSEAALLRLLNSSFNDSSYLNSLHDSVSSAITEALSTQSNTDQYTQLEYSIQKWLGGLYSVGLSDSAVLSIASAINLLATGDVNQLSDSSAQTLLSLSANRAGLSYSSLLTSGVTSEDTDKLLKSMVEYLRDIANNTNSNVVRSQWGDILNLEMSDWRAIQNITDTDINTLFGSKITQQSANTELNTLITQYLPDRYHFSEELKNAIDNSMLNFGLGIAEDKSKYIGWEIANGIQTMGEKLLGEASFVTNIISSLIGLAVSAGDLIGIPLNVGKALLSPDTSISNILSNYEFNMQRGGISNSSSTINFGTSTSSNYDIPSFLKNKLTLQPTSSRSTRERIGYSIPEEELVEVVGNTTADVALTTFKQQEEYQSATAQNVISQENVLLRDINDLYSELFEKQTTPIRVAIAKVEDVGKSDLRSSLEGLSVNIIDNDMFYRIAEMRG